MSIKWSERDVIAAIEAAMSPAVAEVATPPNVVDGLLAQARAERERLE